MVETLKIVVPMAGYGTRLRPHTWSKPKPLIYLAGKPVLDFVLDQMNSLPKETEIEYIFIIGPQGEQIRSYMQQHHPDKVVHYVLQAEMRGQSHAIYQARQYLTGPMLMAFSDTLTETDLSLLNDEECDGVAWVKPVPDPRRFGVAKVDEKGWIQRLIEKPSEMDNNLAVVGFYYFRSSEALLDAIEEQMRKEITLKGEYFLADAVNILLDRGLRLRTEQVDIWLDAGTPESLLNTNRYLLENGHDTSSETARRAGVTVIPPVYVPESAHLENVVIGPNVSLGADCCLQGVIVRDSIIDEGSEIRQTILENSLIGRFVRIEGQALHMNLGDESWAR